MTIRKLSNVLIEDEKGQGLTEYLILVLLIAVISIGATKSLGKTIKQKIQMAREHISQEVGLEDNGAR